MPNWGREKIGATISIVLHKKISDDESTKAIEFLKTIGSSFLTFKKIPIQGEWGYIKTALDGLFKIAEETEDDEINKEAIQALEHIEKSSEFEHKHTWDRAREYLITLNAVANSLKVALFPGERPSHRKEAVYHIDSIARMGTGSPLRYKSKAISALGEIAQVADDRELREIAMSALYGAAIRGGGSKFQEDETLIVRNGHYRIGANYFIVRRRSKNSFICH